MDLRNRVLIVEDDRACESLFKRVIRSLDPAAKVDWAESAEVASLQLVQERGRGVPYNLVVADVFLAGKLTGIDLWRAYRDFSPAPPVVLTSSLPVSRYLETFGNEREIPLYLPKPFLIEECRMLVKRFMASV